MSQQIGRPENRLPERIPEIHFGFLSEKHYIGAVDASHCTNIRITFNDREWKIHAEFRDKDGNIHADDKTYKRERFGGELKEMSAAEQTAQGGKERMI